MAQYIDKAAIVAEIERKIKEIEEIGTYLSPKGTLTNLLCYIKTLEVKEVNIADMADEYYYALREEAANWMDVDTMGHCRLAYYTGCKDVLNKIQKGE